jgi:hypothetical protein
MCGGGRAIGFPSRFPGEEKWTGRGLSAAILRLFYCCHNSEALIISQETCKWAHIEPENRFSGHILCLSRYCKKRGWQSAETTSYSQVSGLCSVQQSTPVSCTSQLCKKLSWRHFTREIPQTLIQFANCQPALKVEKSIHCVNWAEEAKLCGFKNAYSL